MYNLREVLLPDKEFMKKLGNVAIPIALQNMLVSLLAILDIVIIKKLGQNAIASVSLAAQIFFVTNLITFGISSGGCVFLSRCYGSNDHQGVKKYLILIIFLAFLVNSVFVLFSVIAPKTVISMFTNNPDLIAGGSAYLLISAPSFLLSAISISFIAVFRCSNKANLTLILSIVSLTIKAILSYVLIYGFYGIPSLGIKGAGYATLIAKTIELLLYAGAFYYLMEKKYRFTKSDFIEIKKADLGFFIEKTYPVILNESLWGIGIASFSMIFGRMGAATVSAISIAKTLEELWNSFFFGIGNGALVMLGHEIGSENFEKVKLYSRRLAVVGLETGVLIMVGMLLINNVFVDTFFAGLPAGTKQLAKTAITIFALYMPVRSLSCVIIMGILRAGGDSVRAAFYDVLPIYLISIPLGVILGLVFKLPLYIVLPAMYSKRIIKCIPAVKRLLSDKWLAQDKVKATDIQGLST